MNLKPLALMLALGMTQVMALNVLTFDTGNPERNSTVGALGFSITQVGSGSITDIDFTLYDVIYVAQSYEEFASSGLVGALGGRVGDLADYLANGGGLVFGSPAIGNGLGGVTTTIPGVPITTGVDLSTLGLAPLPEIPGLDPMAGFPGGDPAILGGSIGAGRIVGWNPDPSQGQLAVTDDALTLVGNSINWASGPLPAVPEPGSFALMGLGLAGILIARRKAKSQA